MDRISGRPSLAAAAVASSAVACRNHETKPTCAAGCSCEKNMLSLAAARPICRPKTCTFGREAEEGTRREFPGIPGDSESCLRTDKRAKGYTRGGWRAAHGRCAGRTAGRSRYELYEYSSAGRRRGRCSIFAMPTAPASRHLGRDRPKYWRIPCEIAASVSSTRAR